MPWVLFTIFCVVLFLFGRWLVNGISIARDQDPAAPCKVGSFSDSYGAQLLVSQLSEAGIKANAVGGFVSGFQAESPGFVDVFVSKRDYEDAITAIDNFDED